MKLRYFATATAAAALMGGAALAQQPYATDHSKPAGDHAYGADGKTHHHSSAEATAGASIATDATAGHATASGEVTTGATVTTETAPAAGSYAQGVSVTTTLVTNGPVPDTPENRDKYGGPISRAGKMTEPTGN